MKNLLIIEDDPVVAHVYRTSVEKQGFAVEVCSDGESGLQRALEHKPDALLLDLMLPRINGIELLKRFRSEQRLASLPIIVLTNAFIPNMIQEAFDAGASQVFSKGNVTPRHILDALEQLLNGGKPVVNPAPGVVLPTPYELPGSPPPPSNYGYNNNYGSHSAPTSGHSAPGSQASFSASDLEAHRAFIEANKETGATLRKLVQDVIGASRGQGAPEPLLLELCQKTHALIGSAGIAGAAPITHVASVLEALLKEMTEQPKTVNDSTLRTLNSSVEFIGDLFKASAPRCHEWPPANVLIVDDDSLSRRAILFALRKAHLQIEPADIEDPTAALSLAHERAFDLIFLDVQMPIINGFDLCTRIHSLPLNKTAPVLFVTSLTDFKTRAKSTMSGGSDLIAKPFLLTELGLKAITILLRNRLCIKREAA